MATLPGHVVEVYCPRREVAGVRYTARAGSGARVIFHHDRRAGELPPAPRRREAPMIGSPT
jgi:hypothetical protein